MQIAQLRARIDGHDEDIARLERHEARQDELISELRDSFSRLATKDDIVDLRSFLRDRDDLHNARLDVVEDGHQELGAARSDRHSKMMNWLVISLFVIEIGIAIAQYQWMRSGHA